MEVHSGPREQLVRIILSVFSFWLESKYQEWTAPTFYTAHAAASVCSAAFIHYDLFKKVRINHECFFLLFLVHHIDSFSEIWHAESVLVYNTTLTNFCLHSHALYLHRQMSYQHDRYSASVIELALEEIAHMVHL